MKRVLLAAVALMLMVATSANAWDAPKKKEEIKVDNSVMEVEWQDSTDIEMLKQVRSDLKRARGDKDIKTLKVTIISPGGPVVTSLEIARLVRQASEKGLVIEIHAVALCASGCTFVLAAGTPGHRYITKEALYFVHPLQVGGGFGSSSCGAYTNEPKSDQDKIINVLLDTMRDMYMRFSGKDKATVEKWLTCGNEQAGNGDLAVSLGLADKTE